jgi:hypothetical protein
VGIELEFFFRAYGILAIAAFAMFLYAYMNLIGRPDIGDPLLGIARFIVITFFIYMFAKLLIKFIFR